MRLRNLRRFSVAALSFSLFLSVLSLLPIPIASAALASCGTARTPNNTAQNSITVTPSHGAAFYIDSSASQQMDSEYIGYRISSTTTYGDLWAQVGNFNTGSVISLVNSADSPYPVGTVVGNAASPTTVYFLLKATSSSNSSQKHDFKIYQGKPNGQTPLYECTFTFTKVRETIKASANKVSSVSFSTSTPSIGGTFVVTVEGSTGTIGAGASPDNDSIWLSPAPQSNWPSRAIRLEQVELIVDDSASLKASDSCGASNSCYTNQLIVNNLRTVATSLGGANQKNLYYVAKYTYRVMGRAPAFVFKPIALISSGTQMKHSPISSTGNSTGTIDLTSLSTNIVITSKAITTALNTNLTTREINGIRYLGVDYKVTIQNNGSTSVKIDGIKDRPDSAVLIDTTTATTLKTFPTSSSTSATTISPAPAVPSLISGTYTFTTSVTIPSSGRAELTYRMLIPQCATGTKSYANYVVAVVGDTEFGSATAGFAPDATLGFTCGTDQITSTSSGTATRIPLTLTTYPASSITNTSATLNGFVDSNGANGEAISFNYWTNPASKTSVNASPSSTTSSTDPIAVSYSIPTGTLSSGTVYYYEVVAGGVVGNTVSFVTTETTGTPTVVTGAPTSVTATDAVLNGTVDPNQTAVYVFYDVYSSRANNGTVDSPLEFQIFDDPTVAYNNTTNPYSEYSGSFPVSIPLNMNLSNVKQTGTNKTLASMITAGDTITYRAKIKTVSGGTTYVGDWKSFVLTTYSDQTITWNSISDIQWGDNAPSLTPTASSNLAVTITLDPTSTGCTYSGGTLTITAAGTCTLLANQAGGQSGATYFNAAEETPITFSILKNEVTVTAEAKSKFYGDADPSLTYTTNFTAGSLKTGDAFSGSLSRTSGSTVGTYAINQGTLSLSSNYIITYVSANLTINNRLITVTADTKTKTYGDADPTLTYQITSGSLASGDSLSGNLTRVSGENVGTKAINQGTVVVSNASNYTLTYVSANLTITAKTINVVAEDKTKRTSDTDPAFTYTYSPALIASDAFSGSLTRASLGTNTAGTYSITQGTLALSSNYTLVFTAGTLTITDKTVPTLVWSNPSAITYGTALSSTQLNAILQNPADNQVIGSSCTYTPTSGTVLDAGTYTLSATCTPTDTATYSVVSGSVTLTVNTVAITVTAVAKSKIYGDADPDLTYTYTGTLRGSDAFSGALTRGSGENVGTRTITQGTLALSNNYTITYNSNTLTINQRPIAVTAVAEHKNYGESEPTLTYTYTGTLQGSDVFSGSLTRNPGENFGEYDITIGTLALSGNYSVTFNSATFRIDKRVIVVTGDSLSKNLGANDPTLTYQLTTGSLAAGDSLSGSITRDAGQTLGSYAIRVGTLTVAPSASNYTFTFNNGTLTISGYTVGVTAGTGGTAVTSASEVAPNGDVTLTATASSGYTFSGWTCNAGTLTDASALSTTLTGINGNASCSASFTVNSYVLTFNLDGGEISGNQNAPTANVPYSQNGLTYKPTDPTKNGYTFVGWNTSQGSTALGSYSMPASNSTLYAQWTTNQTYTITVTQGSNGTISPGTTTVTAGSNQSFTITANAGYSISVVTVNGAGVGSSGTYTFTNVQSNQTITATFTANAVPQNQNTGPTPIITSVVKNPTCSLGSEVTILGNYLSGATVTVDGVAASVISNNGSAIQARLPAGAVGLRNLMVSVPGATASYGVTYKNEPAPIFPAGSIPYLYVNLPFSKSFAASISATYRIQGSLPPGLTLNTSTGIISGTPTLAGTFNFTLIAENACGDASMLVSFLVDTEIPNAISCQVKFATPGQIVIKQADFDPLKKCLEEIEKKSPETIQPLIFLSGGVPNNEPIDGSPTAKLRYDEICDVLLTLDLIGQIMTGVFNGPEDEIEIIVYWPVPVYV